MYSSRNSWLKAAISWASRNASVTRISEASDVSLTSEMKVLDSGGTDTRAACGRMIRRSVVARAMPMVCAGFPLALRHGQDRGPDHLGGVAAHVQRERDDRAGPRVDHHADARAGRRRSRTAAPAAACRGSPRRRPAPHRPEIRLPLIRISATTSARTRPMAKRRQRQRDGAGQPALDDRPERAAQQLPVDVHTATLASCPCPPTWRRLRRSTSRRSWPACRRRAARRAPCRRPSPDRRCPCGR